MDLEIIDAIRRILISIIPLMLGIILHEVAHGVAAGYCGDYTAKMLGRITINPLPHIDPLGAVFFLITAIFGPFVFGWAKPVPVNPRNFRRFKNPKTSMLIVSLAGPLTNLFLALVFAILLKIFISMASTEFLYTTTGSFLESTLYSGFIINLILMIINLIPIPPLDGSHVLARILPYPLDYQFMNIGRYGMFILLLLIFTGILSFIIKFVLSYAIPMLVAFLI